MDGLATGYSSHHAGHRTRGQVHDRRAHRRDLCRGAPHSVVAGCTAYQIPLDGLRAGAPDLVAQPGVANRGGLPLAGICQQSSRIGRGTGGVCDRDRCVSLLSASYMDRGIGLTLSQSMAAPGRHRVPRPAGPLFCSWESRTTRSEPCRLPRPKGSWRSPASGAHGFAPVFRLRPLLPRAWSLSHWRKSRSR